MKTVVELFLSEYFLIKTILGKYLFDAKKLFASLGKAYLLPGNEVEELYLLAENDIVQKITTENDFLTYQRTQKYLEISGESKTYNSEIDEIVRIKGNAIESAQFNKLSSDSDATQNTIYNKLLTAIAEGSVEAVRIMGIFQCEGVFLRKNKSFGYTSLSKSADWNDVRSTLALLHYFGEHRAYNMQRLLQIVKGTPYEDFYKMALSKYGEFDFDEIPEVNLLEDAFESGVLRREVFESTYLRILRSRALTVKDKEKALFSQSKELLSTIGDLPLNLTSKNIVSFDTNHIKNTALKRSSECEKIERILKNSDLRVFPSFRPLCLCCDSKYVLNMYAKAISEKCIGTHTESIDVSVLTEYDLNPVQNNVFIRNLDENKDNRLLLFFLGDISRAKVEVIKNILLPDCRAKFHLANPNVTLNLSAVLPICFCDEKNAPLLKPYCDVIKLSSLAQDEKAKALQDILEVKEELYGIEKIHMDSETLDMACEYDIDLINNIIDVVIRFYREIGSDIVLTREVLAQFLSDNNAPRIGFGGRQ